MHKPVKWIEISAEKIKHNISEASRLLDNSVSLSVVIKANAYGHGMVEVAGILEDIDRVNSYSVFNVAEAENLRKNGIERTIFILGYFTPDECAFIAENNIIPFIYSSSPLEHLQAAAEEAGRVVRVIVKNDTGMGRLGENSDNIPALVSRLAECPHLEVAGFATHFAQSDAGSPEKTEQQLVQYEDTLRRYSHLVAEPSLNCVANSGGILVHPESHFDMVRLGIGVYGLYPSEFVREKCGLILYPALEYKTRVVHTQKIKKGQSVSYGSTWTAEKESVVAVLPVGYADGYPRSLSNRASVLVNGRKAPVRGRVCMDLTIVDVTDVPGVVPGTEATLISSDENSGCTVDDLAKIANTINYEITTMLPAALPRIVV